MSKLKPIMVRRKAVRRMNPFILIGEIRGLRRCVDRRVDGRSHYEVIDTKLARTPAARHLVQLCVYSELLGVEQGVTPHAMHLVLLDGREASYRTADFSHYFRVARRRFEEFVQNTPSVSYEISLPRRVTGGNAGRSLSSTSTGGARVVYNVERSRRKEFMDDLAGANHD